MKTPRINKPKAWDLVQETEFVRNLGTFTGRFTRRSLLEGYRKSIEARTLPEVDKVHLRRVVDEAMSISEE